MKKFCKLCGKEFETSKKKQKYCSKECSCKSRATDITGQKFGRLTVIKLDHIRKRYRKDRNIFENIFYYLCKCECGNEKIIRVDNLKCGLTQSCGCFKKEKMTLISIKHKLSHSKIYNVWASMKSRCVNKNDNGYKNYGGRGITICDEWDNDFMNFYNWAMDNGYRDDLTIDRIDVNGNYEPSNCRWVTQKIQSRNTRRNYYITYNGETHCVSEWAEILKINSNTIYTRLFNGWNEEKALTEPINVKCRHKKGVNNGSYYI